ncbi:MAG: helix-turn-helix domain-containing protein [Oscillospiraceae bacterium]|nr:helix-turn-helix domain-containing protein [Oscillospiraceae bacterium]
MPDTGSFNRILTLLRKERGITQKEAAQSLGVSQALLSHYEKGIRECGLDFVVRAADYYGVSCDYLLGRSPDRSGLTLSVDEIPEEDPRADAIYKGSVLPVLNKKLLTNSLGVIYDLLLNCRNKEFTTEISNYLMTAVYKVFRILYAANERNQESLFSVPGQLYDGYADAALSRSAARARAMASGEKLEYLEPEEGLRSLSITTEGLTRKYPQSATSLLNLIQRAEKNIEGME